MLKKFRERGLPQIQPCTYGGTTPTLLGYSELTELVEGFVRQYQRDDDSSAGFQGGLHVAQ